MTAALEKNMLPERILAAVRLVCGESVAALHEPKFLGNEIKYLAECIDSTFVSSVGKYVDQFEADLAKYTGSDYAIAVVNGTAALHISLLLAGVKANDEVLIPALTFVASANAVHYCGAVPHFVDCEERSLGLDPMALRDWLNHSTEQRNGVCVNKSTGRIIRALLPMHTFGHPSDLEGILAIASDFGFCLVEDAAESLGSWYFGRHTGTIGKLGAISFNGNKTITTGGGGAILTSDKELARRAKHLTTTAKIPHRWAVEHDEIGFNYRMPNLNAALGCAQLEQLPGLLESKRRLYTRYKGVFSGIPDVQLVKEPEHCVSNYWLQTILIANPSIDIRDEILEITNNAGVPTRPSWTLLHKLKPYSECPRAPLTVAESLEQRIVNLPSSSGLA